MYLACFRPVRVILRDRLDGIMLFFRLLLKLVLLRLLLLRLLHLEGGLTLRQRLSDDGRWRRSEEKIDVIILQGWMLDVSTILLQC